MRHRQIGSELISGRKPRPRKTNTNNVTPMRRAKPALTEAQINALLHRWKR